MSKGAMKPTDPKLSAKMLKDFEKDFDVSKAEKKVITINLDEDILDYFKDLSKKTGKGYQVLIKEALHFFIQEKLEPKTYWKKP